MNYVELLAAYDKLEEEHCMVLESVVLDAETIHRLEAELAKAHEYGYQYRQERNRAEAELAALKAQEPVAEVDKTVPSAEIQWTDRGEEMCLPHGTKLYASPAQPQHEAKAAVPFAYHKKYMGGTDFMLHEPWCEDGISPEWEPLYASQAQPQSNGVIVPDRMVVPKPIWKDIRHQLGDPLNSAEIRGVEMFNLAIDEVLRLNSAAVPAQPHSDQDYIHLCAALYQACGAYDMPERVLDALSAAANAQPFIHLVDGILPCMPDQPQNTE